MEINLLSSSHREEAGQSWCGEKTPRVGRGGRGPWIHTPDPGWLMVVTLGTKAAFSPEASGETSHQRGCAPCEMSQSPYLSSLKNSCPSLEPPNVTSCRKPSQSEQSLARVSSSILWVSKSNISSIIPVSWADPLSPRTKKIP